MKLALRNVNVIDGQGDLFKHANVIIDDGKIEGIEERFDPQGDTLVIDAHGRTLMPGVIDSHVHFSPWGQWLVTFTEERLMSMACQTVDALQDALQQGVTTVRDLGGLEAGFVDAANAGWITSPRMQTCVAIIQPTNGVLDNMPARGGATSKLGVTMQVPGMPSPYCVGPWEGREKVRQMARAGANVIKIATSSQHVNGVMQWDLQTFNEEEISALCDESHRLGLKVTSHARGRRGVQAAIHGGVDGIEHGGDLDDETLREMARRNVWLIPTLFVTAWHAQHDPLEVDRENAKHRLAVTSRTLARAHQLGVPIAMGSDGGMHGPAAGIEEIALMVEAGMPAHDVIMSATSRAAQWLGVAHEVGAVKPGLFADLLLVDGDPITDPRTLGTSLDLVLKGGRPVGGRMRDRAVYLMGAQESTRNSRGSADLVMERVNVVTH